MTTPEEVARIKREALEGLRDWTRSRVETVRDVTQYLREVLPPPAPRKVRAEVNGYEIFGSDVFDHKQRFVLSRVTLRKLAALDARADAEQRIAELEQCAAFVQWVRQEWHHDGDIDGGALQDALTECGLLTPTEVHAPCDPEACQCAEYGEFPVVCYRWADAARQEAAP
jgi:hypothetical protein